MKQRFLNQKLGKRPSYRTHLLKTAKPAAGERPGVSRKGRSRAATAGAGKRSGGR